MLFLIGGIFNSFFLGSILDKYQNYKKLVIFISGLSIVTTLIHFLTLPSGNYIYEGVGMLLNGIAVIPMSSVGQTFAVELAFPVPEALTNGMMMTFSMVFSTAIGTVCSIIASYSAYYALGLWTVIAALALITSIFIDQDLRRLYLDDVKNSEYIEENELRKASFEQREVFFKEAGLDNDLKFRFEFDIDLIKAS
jgi:MFS family permease